MGFYGDPNFSTETLPSDKDGDEEEYFSSAEEEADIRSSILDVSVSNGTPNSLVSN